MKVAVLGDGLLGSELVNQMKWDYYSRKKDSIDILEVQNWAPLLLTPYDTIINCMAYTNTYSLDRDSNWKINVVAVEKLIEYCNKEDKKLIHISTDYLYAGSVQDATEEDVPVHLPTWYGYTKLVGDALVQLRSNNFLICRLSHKQNPFPYPQAWHDINTNCDYVDVIAKLVITLVENRYQGVYNVGTETKTIFELAKQTNPDVLPIFKPGKVPSDTTMNLSKLLNVI